ncbi:hypothetical protein RclHR1_10840004 [Rhizophagus clarus]|uniref:Kinase-like domain-containing protein n=1 Tax=Rhizophagus clarus TaxID=94130 RepID=A0A2Z6QES7_9GLOM|nr:hypothetical protein RclHR1_10840004 [Rhizophagus clarus]GES88225.1 kinase-like domain-containing protein [Rhizophagus clarus]
MEWIPFNYLQKRECIAKGGFGTVYFGYWLNGPIKCWNIKYQQWERYVYRPVALKYLDKSDISCLLEEVKPFVDLIDNTLFIQCLGFSQDPKTSQYIIIMEYAELGSLSTYLSKNNMIWKNKLKALLDISIGLEHLHNSDLIHQDFHPGNLLFSHEKDLLITDLGLCKPADQCKQSDKIYGIIPYTAPEIFKKGSATKESDIYSFGMIMYFIATEKPPFFDCIHDEFLVLKICKGIRPELNEIEIPKCYIELMRSCWNSDPKERPTIIEVKRLIRSFYQEKNKEIKKQFEKAEEYKEAISIKNNQLLIHPGASYTSKLLNPYLKDFSKNNNIDCSIEITNFMEDDFDESSKNNNIDCSIEITNFMKNDFDELSKK